MPMAVARGGSRSTRAIKLCPRGRTTGDGSTTPGGRRIHATLANARGWRRPRAADPRGSRRVRGRGSRLQEPLLFQPKDADSPLMTMPLPSGQAGQLIACVKNSAFGVGPRGVYYVPCDQSPDPLVYLLDPKTGQNARLGTLDGLFERPLGL